MPRKTPKTNQNHKNEYSWFDTNNARLIILCATLGIFGAHKFAQHKTFQGILFILFDITIIGLIVSLIWATLDLIFLTAKADNKPGNMFLGVAFILVNSLVVIPGYSQFITQYSTPNIQVTEVQNNDTSDKNAQYIETDEWVKNLANQVSE